MIRRFVVMAVVPFLHHPLYAEIAMRSNLPEPYFETEVQRITLQLPDEKSAEGLTASILPLFNGYTWAITSRWDDVDQGHLKMREVLARHGYFATFYLNGPEPGEDNLDRKLVGGGFTLGGHTWSHPDLPYCSRNRIFDEVARVRAFREASSDSPVASFAFSFNSFANPVEGSSIVRDIAEALYRAGYIHNAEGRSYFNEDEFGEGFLTTLGSNMPASNLLPSDGLAPIDRAFAAFLADEALQQTNPAISFSMHSWYDSDEAWAQFESELEKYGNRPHWWYCNQSEYGAYRLQYLKARLQLERDGRQVNLTLERPTLLDLNDPIPLTVALGGIGGKDRIVITDGAASLWASGDRVFLNIPHDPSQRLPELIGWIPNESNSERLLDVEGDIGFEGIQGVLAQHGDSLSLRLRSHDHPMESVRVAYRLPLAYDPGVVFDHKREIHSNETFELGLPLTRATNDAKYMFGTAMYLAQIDFFHDGKQKRLYLACTETKAPRDASYPGAGFARLGPLPEDEFTFDEVRAIAKSLPREVTVASGAARTWAPISDTERAGNDVELIVTTNGPYFFGNEEKRVDGWYVLRSTVTSGTSQPIKIRASSTAVHTVFLNRSELSPGWTSTLNAGENELVLVYKTLDIVKLTEKFTMSLGADNVGVFLRLVAPNTGRRLTDIKYSLP